MNMISTGSFQTEANASTKQEELLKVLTAAWEKKNSKVARTGGVSLMALSLAACGGSSEDTTPFDQEHVDAEKALSYDAGYDAATNEAVELVNGLTTSNNTLSATNSTLSTANAELQDANDALTSANNELTTANNELTTANSDLTTDLQTANQTITTINDMADYATEQAAYNAGETAGAASRDDEVAGLNTTIDTINNTDHATEQAAYDAGEDAGEIAGAASRDAEVAGLNDTINNLQNTIAAYEAVEARTLNADGQAIELTASGTIIVAGTTPGADTLNASVDAGGNATVVFDFSDADDTVVLTSADFTGVTAIEVHDGTVDFTAVGSLDGIALTLGSGAVLTAAQATGLGSIALRDGAASYDLTVNVAAGDDIAALTAALNALTGGNVTVAADAGVMTQAEVDAITGATVTGSGGGELEVISTNTAPTLADAPVNALGGAGAIAVDATAATAATVADTENDAGNWNGSTITITGEAGKYLGDNAGDADGVSFAAGAGTYDFSVVGTTLFATVRADSSQTAIGSVANNGETTLGTAEDVAYTGQTITFNANATTAIVNELLTDLTIEDVVIAGTANATDDEGNVTVTISDGEDSVAFTRFVDSDATTALTNVTDHAEIDTTTGATAFAIDNNIGITDGGIDMDGAVLTVAGLAGDTIDLTNADADGGTGGNPLTYSAVSNGAGGFNLVTTDAGAANAQTIIGTISGDTTNSVTVTFNGNAASANVAGILSNATLVTAATAGDHDVTITLSDGAYVNISETVGVSVVADFVNATNASDVSVGGATAAAGLDIATVLAANAAGAVNINGNTYLDITAGAHTGDIASLIDQGFVTVTEGAVIRVVSLDTVAADISGISNLSALGTLSLHAVDTGDSMTMTADQAEAFGTASVDGTVTVDDFGTNLDADLSGITSADGEGATITIDGTDTVFSGNLGNFSLAVDDAAAGDTNNVGTLTMAASVANGKTITDDGNETLVITGVTGSDAYDLSGINFGGAGEVTVNFDADTTLASTTNLGATGANIDVEKNVTLTLTAAQADGLTIDGDQAVGDNTTGGSIAVTALDATLAADLSNVTAGAANAGAIGTSAGAVTAAFDNDGTFTGNFGTAIVTVAAGTTLTAAETVADGATIRGDGSVVVTHTAAGNNFDLSSITASSVEYAVAASGDITGDTIDLGTATVTVDVDQTLTINASDISGITATGDAADNGETGGSFVVTMDVATALDLSTITAGGTVDTDGDGAVGTAGSLTANIADATAMDATTDLGSFDLVLGDDADLSMTAAQADDRSIDGTAAGNNETLSIDVSAAASDLDISGIGANITSTALTSTGSADLSGMTLDATVTSLAVNDGDNDVDADYTVTMTASQADAMNTAGSAAVVTLTSGDSADSIAITVTEVTATDANGNDDFTDDTGVTYIASAGDDTLYGSTGVDDITGGDGADNIFGGTGVDALKGGDGADVISGGDGVDTITGGAGADTMTGGDGDDVYVIAIAYDNSGGGFDVDFASADSGIGSSRDIITDFAEAGIAGGDTITLSDSGYDSDGNAGNEDVTFSFIGTAQFGGNVGEVRYTVTGGNSIVEIDADGDSASDLQIQINNVDVLSAQDFTL